MWVLVKVFGSIVIVIIANFCGGWLADLTCPEPVEG